MKVKIINKESEDFGRQFDVKRINYDQVIVSYPTGNGMKTFSSRDVEYITECEKDELLLKNRFILKIKIPRGVGSFFYKALIDSIEEEINGQLYDINLLKDIYKQPSKRGRWEKEILLQANNTTPLNILCSGENFRKNSYNINIYRLNKEEFIERCRFEMSEVEKQIKRRRDLIKHYEMAINSYSKGAEEEAKALVKTK